jgi:hypothetical protein
VSLTVSLKSDTLMVKTCDIKVSLLSIIIFITSVSAMQDDQQDVNSCIVDDEAPTL